MRLVNFTDIETTGLNEPDERIIEACCSLYDLDTEEHIETQTWRCNPMRKIAPKAQKVHGISLDMVANEPTWDVTAPAVADKIRDAALIVAHNGDHFDFPFIDRELKRAGIFIPFPPTFDTMVEARWATHNGKLPRLGELAVTLDIPYDPAAAHSADYDVGIMAKCFFEGRRLGFYTHH